MKDLVLYEHDGRFVIRVGGQVLMDSRSHRSEEALAARACARVEAAGAPRVLIGGLGFGYTLHAALAALPDDARVVVAEISPAVVAWNRGPVGHLAGSPLSDPRVEVHEGDVGAYLRAPPARLHAILLDVDNGPQAFTRRENHGLYTSGGLAVARRALRPGGVLALWSAARHPDFERRLASAGFAVEVEAPAGGRAGESLYLGLVPRTALG